MEQRFTLQSGRVALRRITCRAVQADGSANRAASHLPSTRAMRGAGRTTARVIPIGWEHVRITGWSRRRSWKRCCRMPPTPSPRGATAAICYTKHISIWRDALPT